MYIHSQILLRLPDRLCSEPGVAFVHGLQVHRLIGPCPNKKLTETANQNKGTTRPVPAKEVEDEQDAGVAHNKHLHAMFTYLGCLKSRRQTYAPKQKHA